MAKSPLITDNSLDALLAKGYISTDLYNTLKSQENKDKALKKTSKDAIEDFRLAQAQMAPPTTASDATNTGQVSVPAFTRPGGVVTNPNGTIQFPEQLVQSSKPPQQLQDEADEAAGVKPYTGPGSTNPYNPDFALGEEARKRALEADKKQEARPLGDRVSDATVDTIGNFGRAVLPDSVGKTLFPRPEDNKKPATKPKEGEAPPGSLTTDQTPARAGGAGGGGAPISLKARWSPEMAALIADLEKSYGDQKIGLSQIKDAAVAQSGKEGEVESNVIRDMELRAKADADRTKAEQDYMNSEVARLTKKADELGAREIDPDRAFRNGLFKGDATANKIIAGIGMLFGAAGTKKGGQNPAVTVINNAIDRDIEMQKADIDTGFKGLTSERGLLAQYMQVTDSRRVAEAAAKLDYLQTAKMKMDQIATQFKGPKAEANFAIASAALDEKLAEQKIQLQRSLELSAKVGAAGGGGLSKLDRQDQKDITEALEKAGIPGVESALGQAEEATKSGESMGVLARGAVDAAGKVNPLAGAAAMGAYGAMEPGALATEQALKNLASEYLLMKSGKAATDDERRDAMQTLFGDRSPQAIARGLGMVRQQVQAKKNNIMSGSGEVGRLEQERRFGQENKLNPSKPPGKPGATK